MNMKFNPIRFATLAAVFTLAACDEIDAPDRFEELPAIKVERCVLIEEFTGQMCTNCPAAHQLINELHAQYGDKVIPVAIHTGSFGIAEDKYPNILGLMNPESENITFGLGIDSYPSARINRNSGILSSNAWADAVRSELARFSEMKIDVSAIMTDKTDGYGNPCMDISTTLSINKNMFGYFELWIVEDSIKAMQIDEGVAIMDYVHNHVFRSAVNGPSGKDITLLPDSPQTFTRTYPVKPNWVIKNLSVVAFFYTREDGVLQAAQCRVVEQL